MRVVDRILGIPVTPINRRRWENFKRNRRGFWSAWIFLALFGLSLFAELLANDKPILIAFDGGYYTPVFATYPETTFGGDFPTEADYRDPFVQELIEAKGWILWPPIRFSYRTIDTELDRAAPSPPDARHWLGTDDQARDVLARVIYGFRISVLFGLLLTVFSSIIGVCAGAVQGFYGGLLDLAFQRFIEIWGGMPFVYILIILSALIVPGFFTLLFLLLLLLWTALVGVVRAEFLRARNLDYVVAQEALGARAGRILARTVLPNVAPPLLVQFSLTVASAMVLESGLSFLGLGVVPPEPSWGLMIRGARSTMEQAPWLLLWPCRVTTMTSGFSQTTL